VLNDPSSVSRSNYRHGINADKIVEVVDRYFGVFFDEGDFL